LCLIHACVFLAPSSSVHYRETVTVDRTEVLLEAPVEQTKRPGIGLE
jgi:hypothetical protein